jgi:hypothetical protein
MALPRDVAKAKYLYAIQKLGGASAYYGCGQQKYRGVKAVAECLEGLKKRLTETEWAEKWAQAYEPIGVTPAPITPPPTIPPGYR